MRTQQQQEPEIVRNAKITVSYNNQRITHLSPAVGLDSHRNVGQQILKRGFSVPHGDYTASFIHPPYFIHI